MTSLTPPHRYSSPSSSYLSGCDGRSNPNGFPLFFAGPEPVPVYRDPHHTALQVTTIVQCYVRSEPVPSSATWLSGHRMSRSLREVSCWVNTTMADDMNATSASSYPNCRGDGDPSRDEWVFVGNGFALRRSLHELRSCGNVAPYSVMRHHSLNNTTCHNADKKRDAVGHNDVVVVSSALSVESLRAKLLNECGTAVMARGPPTADYVNHSYGAPPAAAGTTTARRTSTRTLWGNMRRRRSSTSSSLLQISQWPPSNHVVACGSPPSARRSVQQRRYSSIHPLPLSGDINDVVMFPEMERCIGEGGSGSVRLAVVRVPDGAAKLGVTLPPLCVAPQGEHRSSEKGDVVLTGGGGDAPHLTLSDTVTTTPPAPGGLAVNAHHSSITASHAILVAVKRVPIAASHSNRYRHLAGEIFASTSCCHPNIVRCCGAFADGPRNVGLVLEYMDGGTLDTLLDQWGPLREWEAASVLYCVLQGLQYLHEEHHLLHRDIKPSNVLLSTSGEVKIGDLGIARDVEGRAKTVCGTGSYMAPEVYNRGGYDYRADVYSAGVLLQAMVAPHENRCLGRQWVRRTEHNPLRSASDHHHHPSAEAELEPGTTTVEAFAGLHTPTSQCPITPNSRATRYELSESMAHLSPEVIDAVNTMVHPSAEARPLVREVLQLPFMRRHFPHLSTAFVGVLCGDRLADTADDGDGNVTTTEMQSVVSSPRGSLQQPHDHADGVPAAASVVTPTETSLVAEHHPITTTSATNGDTSTTAANRHGQCPLPSSVQPQPMEHEPPTPPTTLSPDEVTSTTRLVRPSGTEPFHRSTLHNHTATVATVGRPRQCLTQRDHHDPPFQPSPPHLARVSETTTKMTPPNNPTDLSSEIVVEHSGGNNFHNPQHSCVPTTTPTPSPTTTLPQPQGMTSNGGAGALWSSPAERCTHPSRSNTRTTVLLDHPSVLPHPKHPPVLRRRHVLESGANSAATPNPNTTGTPPVNGAVPRSRVVISREYTPRPPHPTKEVHHPPQPHITNQVVPQPGVGGDDERATDVVMDDDRTHTISPTALLRHGALVLPVPRDPTSPKLFRGHHDHALDDHDELVVVAGEDGPAATTPHSPNSLHYSTAETLPHEDPFIVATAPLGRPHRTAAPSSSSSPHDVNPLCGASWSLTFGDVTSSSLNSPLLLSAPSRSAATANHTGGGAAVSSVHYAHTYGSSSTSRHTTSTTSRPNTLLSAVMAAGYRSGDVVSLSALAQSYCGASCTRTLPKATQPHRPTGTAMSESPTTYSCRTDNSQVCPDQQICAPSEQDKMIQDRSAVGCASPVEQHQQPPGHHRSTVVVPPPTPSALLRRHTTQLRRAHHPRAAL